MLFGKAGNLGVSLGESFAFNEGLANQQTMNLTCTQTCQIA